MFSDHPHTFPPSISSAARAGAFSVALICFGFGSFQAAGAEAQTPVARIIATSGVGGRLAVPRCTDGQTLEPQPETRYLGAVAQQSEQSDRPMVLDLGGLLTPHGIPRFAAEHDPDSLARVAEGLGYRALVFGLQELGAPRAGMLAVASALRARGLPMIASNLRCNEQSAALCEVLVDGSDGPSVHLVDGHRVAVLSVIRPGAVQQVSPHLAEGLSFDDPKESIERLTQIARHGGVEVVVAVIDPNVVPDTDVLEFASGLSEEGRPDLLLIAGGGDRLLFARPTTVQPVLAAAPVGQALEVQLRSSEAMHHGYEMLAQPLEDETEDSEGSIPAALTTWIEEIGQSYCDAWGQPLAGGALDRPIDAEELSALVAGIVQERTGADVAILNRDAIDTGWQPATASTLTASDIYVALQFDEPLQTAEVNSAWLQNVAETAEDGSLVTPGLTYERDGDTLNVQVGGHDLQSRVGYRVATIQFLALGGDGALPDLPAGQSWLSLDDVSAETTDESSATNSATLRSTTLEHLGHQLENGPGTAVDPRDELSDPSDTVEWSFGAEADLTFSASNVQNPRLRCDDDTPAENCVDGLVVDEEGENAPAYFTTLLNRSSNLTFGLQAAIRANAAAPDWTWQNGASFAYRTIWRSGRGGGFSESIDQIQARSTLSWTGLREDHHWYIPDPTLDLFIVSEFTQPDSRDWHWLLTRPTAALRFQLLDKLQLQLNGGVQFQPLDPEFEVVPGAGGSLTLDSWDIMVDGDQYARLAFTADYFLADIGNANQSQLRAQIDTAFDLAGPLAFTLRFNIFIQDERNQQMGIAASAVAGLRLSTVGRATGP